MVSENQILSIPFLFQLCILAQFLLCIVLHIQYHIVVPLQSYSPVQLQIDIAAELIENIVVHKPFGNPTNWQKIDITKINI